MFYKLMTTLTLQVILITVVNCEEDKYTSKYDNIDLDAILQNDRLVKNYVDCFLERGKCTKEGSILKSNIKDALQNGCMKCTELQKAGVKKVAHYFNGTREGWWNEIKAKYDPNGEYRVKYDKFFQEEDLDL